MAKKTNQLLPIDLLSTWKSTLIHSTEVFPEIAKRSKSVTIDSRDVPLTENYLECLSLHEILTECIANHIYQDIEQRKEKIFIETLKTKELAAKTCSAIRTIKHISDGDTEARWLSMTMACAYTSMSDKTLMRYVLSSDIRGTKKGGKWYIDKTSIDKFMMDEDIRVRQVLDSLKRRLS